MNVKLITIAITSLFGLGVARAETNSAAIPPERISLYEVPLVCPAAPQIGCGSRSKPILLELEREPSVAQAWLNRAGTLMAVVWKPETKRKERTATFKTVSKKEGLDAHELNRAARKKALADFLSGQGWLRGSDVDRLSGEEAGIMAGRLMRKIRSVITLTDEKAKILQEQSTEIIKRRLTGQLPDGGSPREEILKELREHLDEKEVVVLEEALKDFRPNRDEP